MDKTPRRGGGYELKSNNITITVAPSRGNKNNPKALTDYKFYCFDGKPLYLYVSQGMSDHASAKMIFLTMEWEKAPFGRSDYKALDYIPDKPKKFEEMITIAEKLSHGHKFLRVDLYEIGDYVYFSELTFSPCAGFMPFVPEEYDYKVGELLKI